MGTARAAWSRAGLCAGLVAALCGTLGAPAEAALHSPVKINSTIKINSAIRAASPGVQDAGAQDPGAPDASGTRLEREPTADDLQRQQAIAARLRAQVKLQATGVDGAQKALQAAAVLAGQALEDSSNAVQALQAAQAADRLRQDQLARASVQVAQRQQALGRWARQAYQGGSGLNASVTMSTLLSAGRGTDVATFLVVLRQLGRDRNRDLLAVRRAQDRAAAAADQAAAASRGATAAAITATTAQESADDAVDVQRQALDAAQSTLTGAQQSADAASARADALRSGLLASSEGIGSRASSGDNRVTGAVGSCSGGDVAQFPNGQIPLAALCPLRSAAGQYLRADAAFAFDQLAYAYQEQFASPLCVTDSYRSYAAQVDLFARKPGLAAVPGTSNHGWGTAVDLCGGIEQVGTPQHAWLLLNAPLYGWFHPGWAQADGSRPEPWHWEYSSAG